MSRQTRTSLPPILSFFTGAGFLDLGFSLEGFPVVWRNEYNKCFVGGFNYAMDCMRIPEKINNTKSIVDLGPNQIAKEAFSNLATPEVFGMIGGPPCPDFSVGGKNRGHEGDHGKLSLVYVRRILELQPTFFLFENVPGLIRTTKHRTFLQGLMNLLSASYCLDINIVNALDYGVPQDRERMLLVGLNKKWVRRHENDRICRVKEGYWLSETKNSRALLDCNHWFPWSVSKLYKDARTAFPWPDQAPFGGKPHRPHGLPETLLVEPLICNQTELARLQNSNEAFHPYSPRFTLIDEGDVSRKSFKRLHRWRYSPAAAYGNNEVHLHPTLPRRLSVREALRIQTVPDTYALPKEMTLTSKFKTVGNGVPVRLAQAVARAFKTILQGESGDHL